MSQDMLHIQRAYSGPLRRIGSNQHDVEQVAGTCSQDAEP